MKQPIKVTEAIFPMPVLLVATYNEDGTIDVMNAAWGTMLDRERVALHLTETADELGFKYSAHFTQMFKKHFGMPPSKYVS